MVWWNVVFAFGGFVRGEGEKRRKLITVLGPSPKRWLHQKKG
jgi:hypothetical protein